MVLILNLRAKIMSKTFKCLMSAILCQVMLLCMIPALEKQVDAQTGYERGYDGGMAGDGTIYAHGLDVSAWQESGLNFYNFANCSRACTWTRDDFGLGFITWGGYYIPYSDG